MREGANWISSGYRLLSRVWPTTASDLIIHCGHQWQNYQIILNRFSHEFVGSRRKWSVWWVSAWLKFVEWIIDQEEHWHYHHQCCIASHQAPRDEPASWWGSPGASQSSSLPWWPRDCGFHLDLLFSWCLATAWPAPSLPSGTICLISTPFYLTLSVSAHLARSIATLHTETAQNEGPATNDCSSLLPLTLALFGAQDN